MANVSQNPCEAKESKLVLALVLALALALVLALELVLLSPVPFSDGQSCNPGSGLVLPPWPEKEEVKRLGGTPPWAFRVPWAPCSGLLEFHQATPSISKMCPRVQTPFLIRVKRFN